MDYIGMVYHGVEKLLGNITASKEGKYIIIRISVNDKEMIKFPMPGDSDSNAIKVAITNVINQTKLASLSTRVVLDPVV